MLRSCGMCSHRACRAFDDLVGAIVEKHPRSNDRMRYIRPWEKMSSFRILRVLTVLLFASICRHLGIDRIILWVFPLVLGLDRVVRMKGAAQPT